MRARGVAHRELSPTSTVPPVTAVTVGARAVTAMAAWRVAGARDVPLTPPWE